MTIKLCFVLVASFAEALTDCDWMFGFRRAGDCSKLIYMPICLGYKLVTALHPASFKIIPAMAYSALRT